VTKDDVEEAMRLLYVAKQTGDDDEEKKSTDSTSAIFKIIRQEAEDTKKNKIRYHYNIFILLLFSTLFNRASYLVMM
jgi:hypothetical protein